MILKCSLKIISETDLFTNLFFDHIVYVDPMLV